ncbi:hypothetical protein GUJ93_ZPchr0008g13405 [Zizania palustris]|uniref:Uncharacterized protein n=1 Tax=Zizania palustris TaxID=103762 RepID=A0A8J5V5C0_ZIZPA|nr:hypothetical protein GUJ93_ZPchr0008g13405 [Zizania palustris]
MGNKGSRRLAAGGLAMATLARGEAEAQCGFGSKGAVAWWRAWAAALGNAAWRRRWCAARRGDSVEEGAAWHRREEEARRRCSGVASARVAAAQRQPRRRRRTMGAGAGEQRRGVAMGRRRVVAAGGTVQRRLRAAFSAWEREEAMDGFYRGRRLGKMER